MKGYVIKYSEPDPRCNEFFDEVFTPNSVDIHHAKEWDIGLKSDETGIYCDMDLGPLDFEIGFIVHESEFIDNPNNGVSEKRFTRIIRKATLTDLSIISKIG